MIEFRTFGRLQLRADDGTELSSVLVQPKRVALLAYLAVARPHGFHRRDTLLALLWPELDQEHARAALRKAIHHLRRSLGDDVLIGRGDDEVALDATKLTCDAAQFDDALDRGDADAAIALYQGPFLDGFFVRDITGFEDWLERERQRLHGRAFHAVRQRAERAEHVGDAFGAAHWARHAATLAPDDEPALRGLMSLLDRLSDRAGALSAYDDFARRLAREYEVEPAAETRALAASIRERADIVRIDGDVLPKHAEEMATAIVEVSAAAAERIAPAVARAPRFTRGRVVAALLLVILTTAVAGRSMLRERAPAPVSARVVAVLPFSFRGSAELSYLGEGIVTLLATNLDQVGDIRALDAGAVLTADATNAQQRDAERAGELATRLGAGLFVLGDIVEVNGRLRLNAALHDANRPGRAVVRAAAEGTTAELFDLVDQITTKLIAGDRRAPAERLTRLAALTTHSIPALKAYLTGEQQFRTGRYNEAVESFQIAVAADTTFALGYYRLALAHMWGSTPGDLEMAERAIRFGTRLAEPERALLDGLLPFLRGDVAEAERRYRAILVRRPDESEVWYPLGEVLFHHNPMRGRSAAEAKTAFERTLALGPKDSPLTHLVEIAGIERDYVAFDSLFTGIGPASHFRYVGEMVQALMGADIAARTRVLAALRDSSDARLVTAGRHAMFLLDDRASITQVLSLMTEPARPQVVRAWGHVHLAHLALGAGRLEDMKSAVAAAARIDPGRALEHEAWLHTLPFVSADAAQLRALRRRLAAWQAPAPDSMLAHELTLHGDADIHPQVRLYLLGLIDARLHDDDAARRAADELERLGGPASARALGQDFAHAVRAEIHRERGQLAAALAELESARMQHDTNRLNGPPFYSLVRERYVRAELLTALGRQQEALGWYASFDEHGPWGRAVLAQATLQQARIHDALGHTDQAVRHYARFRALSRDADARFRPLVLEAEARLAALTKAR